MLKFTTVNEFGFTFFAYCRCQRLLKSTSMGSHPLLNGRCQSLLQSTRISSYPLLMVDVKVYYSKQEYNIATFAESICIYKFNECIPENVLII